MTIPNRRAVAIAGHTGDMVTAAAGLAGDAAVRATALGALERLGKLSDEQITTALNDDDVRVRRRAAEIAAAHPRSRSRFHAVRHGAKRGGDCRMGLWRARVKPA